MTARRLFALAGILFPATTAGATDFSALIPPEFAGDRANVETVAVPCRLGDSSDYAVAFLLADGLVLKVASVRDGVPAEIAAISFPNYRATQVEITPVDFDNDGRDELWIRATTSDHDRATWLFAVRNGTLVNITPTLRGTTGSKTRMYDSVVFHAVDGWYLSSWELDGGDESIPCEIVFRWREGRFRYEKTLVATLHPFVSPLGTPTSFREGVLLPPNGGLYVVRMICAHGGKCDATLAVHGVEITSRDALRSEGVAVSAPVSLQGDEDLVLAVLGASDPVFLTFEAWAAASPALPVQPYVDCVVDSGNGTFEGYFGYDNPNPTVVVIPYGEANQVWPAPSDRKQPAFFLPGKHRRVARSDWNVGAAEGVDPAAHDSSAAIVQWKLGALTAIADADFRPKCDALDVPEALE